jgi:hypothetical protein
MAVAENRARVAVTLGVPPAKLATPYQVHGIDVAVLTEVWPPDTRPKADAVVTDRRGIAIGVGTADCGPILFADAEASVVGAAHAGWRGALAGVGEATVAAMEQLGAKRDRIVAVLGPTISQKNYEVGPELWEAFVSHDAGATRFFVPSANAGKFMFDLPAAIVARLTDAGVAARAMPLCTYADPERFFSFRRATHRGEADYGRQLSAIVLSG